VRKYLLALAIVAFVAIVAVILLTHAGSGRTLPPLKADEIELATGDIFGGMSQSETNAYMKTAAATGFTVIRTDVKWSSAKPHRLSLGYDWSSIDKVTTAANRAGLKVHAIIDSPPTWAVDSGCAKAWLCAPHRPANLDPAQASDEEQAMVDFAEEAVKHYDGQLVTVEIANEPNAIHDYAADPGRYARLYQHIYAAIRAQDAHITIEPGAAAAIGQSNTEEGLSAPDWYQALYGAGLGDHMDLLGVHPYTWPANPACDQPDGNWAQMTEIRHIAAKNGHAQAQLDINEMGFPTGGGGGLAPTEDPCPSRQDGQPVSETNQAAFMAGVIKSFEKMHASGQAARLGVFSLIDLNSDDPDSPESHFGIIRSDGSHKPAWEVVHD
jgi:hypothetical protein